jgi:hypothetical protein
MTVIIDISAGVLQIRGVRRRQFKSDDIDGCTWGRGVIGGVAGRRGVFLTWPATLDICR